MTEREHIARLIEALRAVIAGKHLPRIPVNEVLREAGRHLSARPHKPGAPDTTGAERP